MATYSDEQTPLANNIQQHSMAKIKIGQTLAIPTNQGVLLTVFSEVLQVEKPQDNTIATIHSDAQETRECYNNILKRPNRNTKAHLMDANSVYNQIQMHPSDQNKTAFITEYGNYCYKVMPFGLKNAGATYQRLMDKVFAKQIGRNIEVYVDDMVAKTKIGNNHLHDLAKIFGQLQKYNMRLNSEKCTFGVQSGKFLGFLLTSRGIEKPQLVGRLVKWSVELSKFDIKYEGRTSIKSQFMADFIAEFSIPNTTEDYIEWSSYVDGSSNPQGCGAVIILDNSHDNVIEHSLNFSFKASNNQSEYEALIARLRLAADLNTTALKVYCDSLLIVQQRHNHILFVWKYIICRFGIPRHISTDNGRQFADQKFTFFLQNLKIKQHFSSVEHPQTNGLAEAANKVILHTLRKKLDEAKGLWAELIPEIIWGYNTTIHSTTKETPFRLVYGSDAMIPVEISQSSLRTELADQTTQDISWQTEPDLTEEIRSSTAVKHLAMQHHIARRYNQRLHPRSFQVNDLVLKKPEQARKPSAHGKLTANWEGPYRVTQVNGNGAYRLQTLEGKDLPNTWNVSSLKLYYS
ncbi:uncharacterized protein [Arachis hypogaea]|uniref:uncharacterized protein n=1 Tax=Arachis hypogaea TaxID=3818 RepID=UPI003B21C702